MLFKFVRAPGRTSHHHQKRRRVDRARL